MPSTAFTGEARPLEFVSTEAERLCSRERSARSWIVIVGISDLFSYEGGSWTSLLKPIEVRDSMSIMSFSGLKFYFDVLA